MQIKLCFILVVFVVFGVVQAGKFSKAASKVRGGSSWSSAGRDRSRPRPQTTHTHTTHTENKPKPQPNYDNTKLSYGQHETHSAPNKPSAPPAENPHKPSAPQPSNTQQQHVTNQQSGAPNNQPIGWNVGQNQPNQGNQHNIGFDNVNKQAGQGGVNQHNVPQTNSYNPNQGYHPNQPNQGYPNQPGYNPNQQGYHPNQPGYNPSQQGYHPNQPGYPNQGYHPNQGYNPQGGYGGYHPQGGYHPNTGYNHNNGYGYQPPGSNVHYGPVTYINGQQTPAYSYSMGGGGGGIGSSVTSGLLGAFVGYQVAKMFSNSHAPQFKENTYVIHHYHNDTNNNPIPAKVAVEANTVVTCAENITLLCLQHSFPVCMSNGTIMCASNQQYITPCKDNPSLNCIETKVDCHNNPACNATQETQTINVPCLSSVSIYGDLSILKNVINSTDFIPPPNVTVARDNNTVLISGNITNSNETETTTIMTTVAGDNSETTTTTTTTTTTAAPTTAAQPPPTIINNVYCVTVMAVPKPLNKTAVEALPHPLANPEVQDKAKPEAKPESQSQDHAMSSAGPFGSAPVNLILSVQLVYLTLANVGRYF